MNEIQLFLKEFIESKNYKRLVKINSLTCDMLFFHSIYGEADLRLENFMNFVEHHMRDRNYHVIVNVNCTYRNKRGEYLLNSEYTLKRGEVVYYYHKWKRDRAIENIID